MEEYVNKEEKEQLEQTEILNPNEIYKKNQKKMLKNISNKTIVLITIVLDITLFILFANGINIFVHEPLIESIKSFGYVTILNLPGIIGIEMISLNLIDIYLSHKRFIMPVIATCIGNNEVLFTRDYDSDGRDTPTFTTSWEYEYNGQIYIVKNTLSTNIDLPKIGSTRKIYINPNSPYDDYYDPIFVKKTLPIFMLIGIVCLLAFIGIIDAGVFKY